MNDKKKNPLEGIFARVTDDDLLRENGLLYAENKQLQSNWNSLSEFVDYQLKHNVGSSIDNSIINHVYQEVRDKMNELKSGDNNGKS